jgi:hypothetical protein
MEFLLSPVSESLDNATFRYDFSEFRYCSLLPRLYGYNSIEILRFGKAVKAHLSAMTSLTSES